MYGMRAYVCCGVRVCLEKMHVGERLEHGIQGKKQERYSRMEGYMVRTRDVLDRDRTRFGEWDRGMDRD